MIEEISRNKHPTFSKAERKILMIRARKAEYDDDYTMELCPNCDADLKDNYTYLFEKGKKDKWIFVRCNSCNQVVCL